MWQGVKGHDVNYLGHALSEGACLVKGYGLQSAGLLQVDAAFNEDAVLGGAGYAGEEAYRGGYHQGAGAGYYQEDQSHVEPRDELCPQEGPGYGCDQKGRAYDDGCVYSGKPVYKTLVGGLLGLALLYEMDYAGQGGVFGQVGYPYLQYPFPVDGPSEDLTAYVLFHRDGLPCDWGLVHGGIAFHYHSIKRYLFGRSDNQGISQLDLVNRQGYLFL